MAKVYCCSYHWLGGPAPDCGGDRNYDPEWSSAEDIICRLLKTSEPAVQSFRLNRLIDRVTGSNPDMIAVMLESLSSACVETATHVEANWQDHRAKNAWLRIALAIDRAVSAFRRLKPY